MKLIERIDAAISDADARGDAVLSISMSQAMVRVLREEVRELFGTKRETSSFATPAVGAMDRWNLLHPCTCRRAVAEYRGYVVVVEPKAADDYLMIEVGKRQQVGVA